MRVSYLVALGPGVDNDKSCAQSHKYGIQLVIDGVIWPKIDFYFGFLSLTTFRIERTVTRTSRKTEQKANRSIKVFKLPAKFIAHLKLRNFSDDSVFDKMWEPQDLQHL